MTYANGNKYTGEWVADAKNGHGTMEWFDSQEKYTGEWRDGYQFGQGEHIWLRPQDSDMPFQMRERYTGEWVRGQREGFGTFYYANGSSYTGMWQGNQKHGEGRFTFEDGSVFEGVFVRDRMAEGKVEPAAEIPAHLMGTPADEVQSVHNILVQYGTINKQIYWHYTQVGCNQQEAFLMSLGQFHRFVLDAKLCSPTISLAQIQRVVFPHLDGPPAVLPHDNQPLSAVCVRALLRREDAIDSAVFPEAPAATLAHREFVQSLVSIAALVKRSKEGLSQQLRLLITDHLLPLTLDGVEQVPQQREALQGLQNELRLLYTYYSRSLGRPRHAKAESHNALTVRALLRLLTDAGLITGDTNVVGLFLEVLPPYYCADLAMAFNAYCEALAAETSARKAARAEREAARQAADEAAGEGAGEPPAEQEPEEEWEEASEPDDERFSQITDTATCEAFSGLLDTQLLYIEFEQVVVGLAYHYEARKKALAAAEAARGVLNQEGSDAVDAEGHADSTEVSEGEEGGEDAEPPTTVAAEEEEENPPSEAELCSALLIEAVIPNVLARLDAEVERFRGVADAA